MSEYTSFIELLIKQTCRRASQEFEMGSKQSSGTGDPSSVYSLQFLRTLHSKPREHICKLIKGHRNSSGDHRSLKGFNIMNDKEFTKDDRTTLLEFLSNVKDMSPDKQKEWIDLQHYMHYVYRNFASAEPDPSTDVVSAYFVNEVKTLVESLIEDDESQLYLRILALLREYCIFAHWNYSKSGTEHAITKLFYYYEALLSAAKNISTAFEEFEYCVYKNYNICWIDFNTCMFIKYFFETDYVQNVIYKCLVTKDSPGDTPPMFSLLEDLQNLWIKEQRRVRKLIEKGRLPKSNDQYEIEKEMIDTHKKVLSTNYWVHRSDSEQSELSLVRLDHQLFRLVADPTFHPAGPILDRNGQCICEECMIAKYRYILEQNKPTDKILKSSQRLTYCRRCQNLVELDYFHRHINSHALIDMNPSKSQKRSTNLSRIISEKVDFLLDEPLAKMAIEASASDKFAGIDFTNADTNFQQINVWKMNNRPKKENDDLGKVSFEEFLKQRQENIRKAENIRTFVTIKKDIFEHTIENITHFPSALFNNILKQSKQPLATKKADVKENDSKSRELRKNGHNPYPVSSSSKCAGSKNSCEHSCKQQQEEPAQKGGCTGRGAICDHQKEQKKCDCTYCEVFGNTVAAQTHKSNELRDRLRNRLHQRREKRTKDCRTPPAPLAKVDDSMKVKSIINKVEERVPLPSSPTNIPPAPSIKSSTDSSITSINSVASRRDDIHGLVNYIEGHGAMNKMELAQKKADKKARQRMKKVADRLRQDEEKKKLADEMKKKEEERKKLLDAQTMSDSMKNSEFSKIKTKKERQIERTLLAKEETKRKLITNGLNFVVETFPAMVSIKKYTDSEELGVAVTLKSSTPDKDTLLYNLMIVDDDSAIETAANKKKPEKSNQKNQGKTKKKKRKEPKPAPACLSKDLTVTLTLDPNCGVEDVKKNHNNNRISNDNEVKKENKLSKKEMKKEAREKKMQEELPIPMLHLPPGITITKVKGPISNKNYMDKNSSINVGKSGVIVVDTEKLIKKSDEETATNKAAPKNKKKKKNKNKSFDKATSGLAENSNGKMVTLKNPFFNSFPSKPEPVTDKNGEMCAPAAIFTNENGMVTIRSSRLQQTLVNGGKGPNPATPVASNLQPELPKQAPKSDPFVPTYQYVLENESEPMSPFNAQEILSGLPGIEITKVDKKGAHSEAEVSKACETAEVSIIPSSNGDKFDFDKDDWLYGWLRKDRLARTDSVFTPRDVLEDDMDPDELELEAFKRFCQQSIPPKRKEKVAHLNVAELVLSKKNDYSCF